jgi:Mrp family chromosome partitioning ATPase/capsular polysaccharide biosynthesis protein
LTAATPGHAATLRDYLHVAARRKWAIVAAAVVTPLAAVLYSSHQVRLYEAQAKVLLSTQNLAAQLTNTQSTGLNLQPDRIAATQATVARVPDIAQRALADVTGSGLTVHRFLEHSNVSTAADADILTFDVVNGDPQLARRLVDAYAREYTRYRRQLDTASIAVALRSVNDRIAALEAAGDGGSTLHASLVDRQATLATMAALQTSNATVVEDAPPALQVQPKPVRNGILGLALGIVLGIGLALLWEALDTRVRTAHEISERLDGAPLLARLTTPSRRLRSKQRLVMVEEPHSVQAEAFRMLRTNLEFIRLDRDVQTVMVTSAVEQEGKSTTVANLAVALARAGQRVVLVDLDLRRPFLAKFFDLDGPGVTEVALGYASLDEALASIVIDDGSPRTNGYTNGHGPSVEGVLEVLPAGPIPPDPGEFVTTQVLGDILRRLRDRADLILIDAPPALRVGDAVSLSARVDGILVITRMKTLRRQMLAELARQLATVPTPVLGFVVTGAGDEDGYGSSYGEYSRPYGAAPARLHTTV